MISRLTGIVEDLRPVECILNVQGVGYQLHIPLSTFEKISEQNEACLEVYTHHKEDQLKLFGFFTLLERQLFTLLITISGIGPSVALSILSGITVNGLINAVKDENTKALTGIPGIGKGKAEKLIFELKRKKNLFLDFQTTSNETPEDLHLHQAIDALLSLGFDENNAKSIIKEIYKKNPSESVENLIKKALKTLA